MSEDLIAANSRLVKLKETFALCAGIFAGMGFKEAGYAVSPAERQILFDNQYIGTDYTLQLTVVGLLIPDKIRSQTFNFDFNAFPGHTSPVSLQQREVKTLKLQLIESDDYRQFQLQLYFRQPLNYTSEDLIYRVRVDKMADGYRINTGIKWLTPELHMSDDAALELVRQIKGLPSHDG